MADWLHHSSTLGRYDVKGTDRNHREDWREMPRKWGMEVTRYPFDNRSNRERQHNTSAQRQSGDLEANSTRLISRLRLYESLF